MIATIIIVEIRTMTPMVPGVTQQIQKFAGKSATSDGADQTKVHVKLLAPHQAGLAELSSQQTHQLHHLLVELAAKTLEL